MPTYSTSTPSATIRQETEPSAADYLYWIKASTNETFYSDGTIWTLIEIFSIPTTTTEPTDKTAGKLWLHTEIKKLFISDGTNYLTSINGMNYKLISSTSCSNQTFNLTGLSRDTNYLLLINHKSNNNSNATINNDTTTNAYNFVGFRFDANASIANATLTYFQSIIYGQNNITQEIFLNGSSGTSTLAGAYVSVFNFGQKPITYSSDKYIATGHYTVGLSADFSFQCSSNITADIYLLEGVI